jgi:hypothetical protein
MITRKIRICENNSLIEVKPLRTFKMFGESFFAHRTYSKKPQTRSNRTFTVTEFKSGFAVCSFHAALLRDELLESRKRLESIGEEKTKSAINTKVQELGLAN